MQYSLPHFLLAEICHAEARFNVRISELESALQDAKDGKIPSHSRLAELVLETNVAIMNNTTSLLGSDSSAGLHQPVFPEHRALVQHPEQWKSFLQCVPSALHRMPAARHVVVSRLSHHSCPMEVH